MAQLAHLRPGGSGACSLVCEGFYVREKNAGAANWDV